MTLVHVPDSHCGYGDDVKKPLQRTPSDLGFIMIRTPEILGPKFDLLQLDDHERTSLAYIINFNDELHFRYRALS